jgi:LysM repeat protein
MRRRLLPVLFLAALTLAACRGRPDQAPVTGGDGPQPYQTLTPSPTPSPAAIQTEVLLPTPTPLTYIVRQGDTLSGIAERFGVPLDDLIAANPGASPTALTVGTTLNIPVGGNIPGEPTPTPVPLTVRQVRCWPDAGGGLWCFALLQNEYAEMLENLSMQFSLRDGTGQEVAAQTVYALLDVLGPGEAMPLAAYFPAPLPADLTPAVLLLTAIRLLPGDTRYLPAATQNTLVETDWSGRTAHVSGQVLLTASSGTADTLWVLAAGYDAAGNVVALRRWEAASPLSAGGSLPFELTLSSVGPAIERVEFLVEARP